MVFTHHKIYLIRHGETEWALAGKHTGLTDIPLTENGELQAKKIGTHLSSTGFQKVFVSPLIRAKETCRLSGYLSEAIIDPLLVEWNYGKYEGKTTAEIRKDNPHWSLFSQGVPEGESLSDVSARASQVLGRLRSIPGDVAIFSSGHFLRVLAARWLDLPASFGAHLVLSPGSISILGFERETPALLLWNQT